VDRFYGFHWSFSKKPMLNLHDPQDSMRAHFREVWQIYSVEGESCARAHLDEGVRSYLRAHEPTDEAAELERLQVLLMEEKRRWEDVQAIADLIASKNEGQVRLKAVPEWSSPSRESKAFHRESPDDRDSVAGAPQAKEPSHAGSAASAGGLDLAGMIDGMLREERSSA